MGEYFSRAFNEEWIFVVSIWKQGRRKCQCFGVLPKFSAGRPIRHPLVEWIQNHVAARGIKKLRSVFECRIVNDGALAALFDLDKELPYESALARSCIAHDEDMARLDPSWNAHRQP